MTDILILDDESDIRTLLSDLLEDEGYKCRTAAESTEFFTLFEEKRPALVLLDIWIKNSPMDGLRVLEILHKEAPDLPIIMISGHGTIEMAVKAVQNGASDFIEKPIKIAHLLLTMQRAIEKSQLKRENSQLKEKIALDLPQNDHLIGQSSAITMLTHGIEKAAPTNSRIMISGAMGGGKETIARLIHKKSPRAHAPFIGFSPQIYQNETIEGEFFGIADKRNPLLPEKVGLLEKAHGGVLYIDEVTDVPLPIQHKIVRFLSEKTFQRLGSDHHLTADVRIISTTNVLDVLPLIKAKKLREDFYHRLNVVHLRIPPLCERREDIPDLLLYFKKHFAKVHRLPEPVFAEEVVLALQAYKWEGNVRQLKNIVEQLVIMYASNENNLIKLNDLPPEILGDAPSLLQTGIRADFVNMPLREAREAFERDYLLAQLMRFHGNISRTAGFIGMERSALHRKLKSLDIGLDLKQSEQTPEQTEEMVIRDAG